MKKIVGPNLKLTVTKGPSSGYESEFLPGVKINIGRVLRGNKISIKDAGISSKHLVLQFDSGSGNWTVTDLDSSNGTILNDKSLTPSTPYTLSDDDIIKFGEETAIKIKIEVNGDELVKNEENVAKPSRVTRRRAAANLGKLGVIEEDSELGLGFADNLGKKEKKIGTGRVKKNENTEIVKEDERLENLGENEVKDEGIVSTGLRRSTRSSSRKGKDGDKNGVEIGDAGTGRVTRGGRRTRSSRTEEVSEMKGYAAAKGPENMGAVEEGEKGPAKSQKRTSSTSIENSGLGVNVVEGGLVVNTEVVDGRSNCARVRKKLEVEVKASASVENGQIREQEMVEKSYFQEGDCGEVEKNGEGDRVESMPENVCGDGLTNLPRTNLNVLERLEKMTLGQWLDYIEDYLPKQIVAETEEMILEMRCKAEKFHEFMLQQKAAKGGGGI